VIDQSSDQPTDQPAIDPWRAASTAHDRRRYELFLLAAPVFARHGFRGSTIRALAHACHLSPAGLYHYFRSKEELATYALRTPRVGWERTYIDPSADPLAQLRDMLELAIRALPVYMLALRMAEEIGDAQAEALRRATFRDGEQMLARFVSVAAPSLDRPAAEETARLLIAVLVGSAFADLDPDTTAVRGRATELLRPRLVPDHVQAEAFDRVFAS
jgi:AcrR family transcriptional regulator